MPANIKSQQQYRKKVRCLKVYYSISESFSLSRNNFFIKALRQRHICRSLTTHIYHSIYICVINALHRPFLGKY